MEQVDNTIDWSWLIGCYLLCYQNKLRMWLIAVNSNKPKTTQSSSGDRGDVIFWLRYMYSYSNKYDKG